MKFKKKIFFSEPNEVPQKSSTLSLEQGFDCTENGFYCGKFCQTDERHPERNDSHLVETLHL